MGSWVIRVMGFLPANFQLAVSFHSRLRVRHGQTDGQTEDGHQRFMPHHPLGAGHNNGCWWWWHTAYRRL